MKTILNLLTTAVLLFALNSSTHAQSGDLLIANNVEIINKIVKAIDKKGDVDYFESPFDDVLKDLGRIHEIPIDLHDSALDNGLSKNSIVSITLKDMTLYATLNRILEPYRCTLSIENETLLVVSKDHVNNNQISWSFDLSRLLESAYEGNIESNAVQLQDSIQKVIDPDSWEDVGGWASITFVDDTMIVTQSLENLRTIHQLLYRLDKSISGE